MTDEQTKLLAKILLDDDERIDMLAQLVLASMELSAKFASNPLLKQRLNFLVSSAEQLSASHAERAKSRNELKSSLGLI